MNIRSLIVNTTVLLPLSFIISYYDVRYRRIPNAYALSVLISGLIVNAIGFGLAGLLSSMAGAILAFGLMFAVRLFTGLGAGDIKLFGAIGALIGAEQALQAFFLILILGGVLAVVATIRAGLLRRTMVGVYQIFYGFLVGGQPPPSRDQFAQSGMTVPYGVAITFGSLIFELGLLAWA